VQVSWASGSAVLMSGEVGMFPPLEARAEPLDARDAAAPKRASGEREQRPLRGWREWAQQGDYARAYSELYGSGAKVLDDATDLMLAADVARLSAHPEAAVAPLRKLCTRYPKDKRAPVAAFTLGRVLSDDLGRAADAASAFETAHALWPTGPLSEDALARAAEAWQRAQSGDRAHGAAQRYLQQFPAGRHAPAMRKALAQNR
jgi:transmembrane sensor